MNAELARHVVAGGNDSPLFRQAAHGHGLARQGGIVPLLHRSIEAVAIAMDDVGRHGRRPRTQARLRSKCFMKSASALQPAAGMAL